MEFINIDLESIKFKLMSEKSGLGWSIEFCDQVELQYKRWMTCIQRYPNQRFVPSHYIDTFWHYHILDTEKYAADCYACFGYFIHHYPYFGMQEGDDDRKKADIAWNETKKIFKSEFGCEIDDLEKSHSIQASSDCVNYPKDCGPGACAGQECNTPGECENKIGKFDTKNLIILNQMRPRPLREADYTH